jgi:hypothetical protein
LRPTSFHHIKTVFNDYVQMTTPDTAPQTPCESLELGAKHLSPECFSPGSTESQISCDLGYLRPNATWHSFQNEEFSSQIQHDEDRRDSRQEVQERPTPPPVHLRTHKYSAMSQADTNTTPQALREVPQPRPYVNVQSSFTPKKGTGLLAHQNDQGDSKRTALDQSDIRQQSLEYDMHVRVRSALNTRTDSSRARGKATGAPHIS